MQRTRIKTKRRKLSSLADVCDFGSEIEGTACVRLERKSKKEEKIEKGRKKKIAKKYR